jgi:hypothetical protein
MHYRYAYTYQCVDILRLNPSHVNDNYVCRVFDKTAMTVCAVCFVRSVTIVCVYALYVSHNCLSFALCDSDKRKHFMLYNSVVCLT